MKIFFKIFILTFLILALNSFNLLYSGPITIEINLNPELVELTPQGKFHRVWYRDINIYSRTDIGDPDIPAYMMRVLVPEGFELNQIDTREINRVNLGNIIPYPFQGHEILSKPKDDYFHFNKEAYRSGMTFPSEVTVYQKIGKTRGFNILYFSFYPFVYDSDAQELFFIENVSFEISYDINKNSIYTAYRPNETFTNIIKNSVLNPRDLKVFYPNMLTPVEKSTDFDMLIISTEYLREAAQTYAEFRASSGISYHIKTVSEIDSNYQGPNIQLKIKNCIFQYVQNHNITYVFLIGDGGYNTNYSVPDQNLYGYLPLGSGTETDNTIPGDIFYTCFDDQFNWNANNNDRVGEMGVDNADISPDVIIGRLSVRTPQQILDYLNKVETYFSSINDPYFAENLLLSGVQLFYHSGDAKAKSERMYNEYIAPYWDIHNKYTLYDSDTMVNISTLSQALEQNMNLFHMATHGSVTSYSMSSGASFHSNNALQLQNIPGIVITIACTTNAFDPEVSNAYDPCLGEAFTRNPDGGSIAYIGASRYGIGYTTYDTHGPSFQYNNWVFKYLLQPAYHHNIGAALMQSKIQMVGAANSDHFMRFIHFALNLLGDPSIKAHTSVEILGPYPIFNGYTIDDSMGNNNGIPNIGETFKLYINFRNAGNQPAIIDANITTDSNYATILQDSSSYPSIPAGGSAYNAMPFKISISEDCPHNTLVPVTISWTSALGGPTSHTFDIKISSENIISIGDGTAIIDRAPLYTYYHDNRTQIIYHAEDLGGFDSVIHSLSIEVDSLPGMTMNNWTIRMKHTSKQDYSSNAGFENQGWTIVYQNNENISDLGWVEFEFDTPFEYNGTDNLMIDLSFNNTAWTMQFGKCTWTPTDTARTIYSYTDSYYGDPLNWSGSNFLYFYSTSNILNIELLVDPNFPPPSGVTLDFFNAYGHDGMVDITWGTLSEVDLTGWNLYRIEAKLVSPHISPLPVKLNSSLIPPEGGEAVTHTYEWTDMDVPHNKFFYILQAVYTSGGERWQTLVHWE